MWLWFLGVIIFLVLLLVILYNYYMSDSNYWVKRGVPLVSYNEIFTSVSERLSFKVPFHFVDQRMYNLIKSKNEKFVGSEEMRKPVFLPVDLDLIKHILVKDFEFFVNRRNVDTMKTDEFFGEMMLIKENQEWKDLRSTMSPTFTTGKIRRMFQVFEQSGSKMVKFTDNIIKDSSEMDLKDICGKYTMDVIASAAFGIDSQVFDDPNAVFSQMGKRFQNNFNGFSGVIRLLLFALAPKLAKSLGIPTTDVKSARYFVDVVKRTKAHRIQSGEKREDFLQLMMEAQAGQLKSEPADSETADELYERDAKLNPEKLNKIKITDPVITAQSLLFFIAGFDTTETLLAFAVYELALNPDVQEKLFQEIEDAVRENDGKLTYDAINKMNYLDNVISETLRMYPPGIRTERQATFDYKLPDSDLVLPKGTVVAIPIYAIHHDAEYFPDPEKFDPERFSPEAKAKRHPYAYMPFGVGPRNCIAMRFALIEGKTAIAKIVQNFILEPCSKTHIPMKYPRIGVMKPDGGMWLNVKPRNRSIEE